MAGGLAGEGEWLLAQPEPQVSPAVHSTALLVGPEVAAVLATRGGLALRMG
jgi:hypothetical protein